MSTTTLAAAPAGFPPEHEETPPHAGPRPHPWHGPAPAVARETAPARAALNRRAGGRVPQRTQTTRATRTVGSTGTTGISVSSEIAGGTEVPEERMTRAAPEPDAGREPAPGADPNRDGQDLAPLNWDDPDLGASTAEYAVIVLAAAAFGGVMAAVLSSDSVSGMLLGIIQKALSF